MDWLTVVTTLVGIGATWAVSHLYYGKGKTDYEALIQLIKSMGLEKPVEGLPDAPDEETGFRWVLIAIEAYEKGDISLVELSLFARQMESAGRLLLECVSTAGQLGPEVGYTLSPPWQEARRKKLESNLATLKVDLQARLRSK